MSAADDFGLWKAAYWRPYCFVRRMTFRTIHDVALALDRERVGQEAGPIGGILDSQTVKAAPAMARGFDVNKRL